MPTHRMLCTAEEAKGDPLVVARTELARPWLGKETVWAKRRIVSAKFTKGPDGPELVITYKAGKDEEDVDG